MDVSQQRRKINISLKPRRSRTLLHCLSSKDNGTCKAWFASQYCCFRMPRFIGADIGMYTIWIKMTQSSKEDIRILSLLWRQMASNTALGRYFFDRCFNMIELFECRRHFAACVGWCLALSWMLRYGAGSLNAPACWRRWSIAIDSEDFAWWPLPQIRCSMRTSSLWSDAA